MTDEKTQAMPSRMPRFAPWSLGAGFIAALVVTPILSVRWIALNPVENLWQYIRSNWLSNRVFEDYEAIINAGCDAWNKMIDQPETIKSIGSRKWAHIGQI